MKVEQTDRCCQRRIKSAIFSEQAKIEKLRGLPYVPRTYDLGEVKSLDGKKYSLIIIDLLGKDLESHLQNCGGQFPLQTVLHIGIQLVQRIEAIHNRGIIHRDIKPENLLTGRSDARSDMLYTIDFGLSKMYTSIEGKNIPLTQSPSNQVGTPNYMSVNTHLGYEASRRDDLEPKTGGRR